MQRFVALDVETANTRFSSICSIGAARFEDDRAVQEFYTLIDPQAEFHSVNVAIHGIGPADVEGAPTFDEVLPKLNAFVEDRTVVHHTHFDRTAIQQAAEARGATPPNWEWLDSARVTRRVWPHLARRGYGLANVCEMIGYNFEHHHALADAKACGEVILAAARECPALDLAELAHWPLHPDGPRPPSSPAKPPPPADDGPLIGETIVFTGALAIPRRKAWELAASLGCRVGASVTKRTTLLVVGDIDAAKLAGRKQSRKQQRAEELITDGQEITILAESDFLAYCRTERRYDDLDIQ